MVIDYLHMVIDYMLFYLEIQTSIVVIDYYFVVVDYINVLFVNFAIFNFADICVCVGVGLLMVWVLFDSYGKEKSEKKAKPETVDPADDAHGTD